MATSAVTKRVAKSFKKANVTQFNDELRKDVSKKFTFLGSLNMGVEGTGNTFLHHPRAYQFAGHRNEMLALLFLFGGLFAFKRSATKFENGLRKNEVATNTFSKMQVGKESNQFSKWTL